MLLIADHQVNSYTLKMFLCTKLAEELPTIVSGMEVAKDGVFLTRKDISNAISHKPFEQKFRSDDMLDFLELLNMKDRDTKTESLILSKLKVDSIDYQRLLDHRFCKER